MAAERGAGVFSESGFTDIVCLSLSRLDEAAGAQVALKDCKVERPLDRARKLRQARDVGSSAALRRLQSAQDSYRRGR